MGRLHICLVPQLIPSMEQPLTHTEHLTERKCSPAPHLGDWPFLSVPYHPCRAQPREKVHWVMTQALWVRLGHRRVVHPYPSLG